MSEQNEIYMTPEHLMIAGLTLIILGLVIGSLRVMYLNSRFKCCGYKNDDGSCCGVSLPQGKEK